MSRGKPRSRRYTDQVPSLGLARLKRVTRLAPGTSIRWQWDQQANGCLETLITVHPDSVEIRTLTVEAHPDGLLRRSLSQSNCIERVFQPCHLGGHREVWRCPSGACGRQVMALYFFAGCWACRHCHGLSYRTQSLDEEARLERQLLKLNTRLGWSGGVLTADINRPKGMHERTFHRLTGMHLDLLERWCQQFSAGLGLR